MATKPDFLVKAINDGTQRLDASKQTWSKVGAAWLNKDGSISLVLDHFVVLKGDGHNTCRTTIMLYPHIDKE